MRRACTLLSVLVAQIAMLGCGDGTPDVTPETLAEATGRVREAFHLQDYEYGAELGEQWADRAPEALELKAWTVASLAKARQGDRALSMAEEMVATHPDSAWSSFALAAARTWAYDRDYQRETLEASQKALAMLPELIDAVTLRADALGSSFRGPDSVLAFLNGLPDELRREPQVQFLRAKYMWPADDAPSDEILNAIISIHEDVLQADPSHIDANLNAADLFDHRDEPERALSHLERAAAVTPSPRVHRQLWWGILEAPSLSDEEKWARISADVHHILENVGDSAARLAALAWNLRRAEMAELETELENRVLEHYPSSRAAEVVLANRFQSLAREILKGPPSADTGEDLRRREQLADMLVEFIDRRWHFDADLLLDARWTLFMLQSENPHVDRATLTELANAVAAQLTIEPAREAASYFGIGARILAEFPEGLEDARRLIDLGLAELESQEETDPRLETDRAWLSLATGRVLLQEERLDEAEEVFAQARDLDPERGNLWQVLPFAYLYSGNLMEVRAEVARAEGKESDADEFLRSAEDFYLDGLELDYYAWPILGIPWTNPNETALKELFRKRNGGLEGFEAYLTAVSEESRRERREEALAERIPDPEPVEAFALETLDGEEVTFESYLGKVVIINFWGTW